MYTFNTHKPSTCQHAATRLVTETRKYERGLSRLMHTGWLFLSECSTSLLWQSIVVFGIELRGTSSTTVCQSSKFLVASNCDLPEVMTCQFLEFAIGPLGPVHFLLPDQQSGIYCLIIRAIQLLTPNNLGRTWRRICSPDIWGVSALELLRNRALQIDILLTYLLTS